MATGNLKVMLIGSDASLTYLIQRYAEQSGYELTLLSSVPSVDEVCNLRPAAILFASIDRLEAAQSLIEGLANCEIPVLVCSSVAD
jgi:hypothetical protein